MTGFKTATITGVHVETQEKSRVDVKLELGQVTEKVEVTAEAVALKTDDATVDQVIEHKRITGLPLNAVTCRCWPPWWPACKWESDGCGGDSTKGGFPIPGASMSIIANGQREINSNILLDGFDAKEPRTHITVFTPSREAGIPGTGFTIGARDGGNGWKRLSNFQWSDSLTVVRNRHTFKTGFEFRYIRISRAAANIATLPTFRRNIWPLPTGRSYT